MYLSCTTSFNIILEILGTGSLQGKRETSCFFNEFIIALISSVKFKVNVQLWDKRICVNFKGLGPLDSLCPLEGGGGNNSPPQFPISHRDMSSSQGCRACECSGDQKGRPDKRFINHSPSTMQGGEDYTINKLYLANWEMKKLFNEER